MRVKLLFLFTFVYTSLVSTAQQVDCRSSVRKTKDTACVSIVIRLYNTTDSIFYFTKTRDKALVKGQLRYSRSALTYSDESDFVFMAHIGDTDDIDSILAVKPFDSLIMAYEYKYLSIFNKPRKKFSIVEFIFSDLDVFHSTDEFRKYINVYSPSVKKIRYDLYISKTKKLKEVVRIINFPFTGFNSKKIK